MIPAWKVYFKVAWACKTPFVFLLDRKHKTITRGKMMEFYLWMPNLEYVPELRDCDNFAFMYKGIADRQTNAVGIILGWAKWARLPHLWNTGLTDEGVLQIEPQNAYIFKRDLNYRPWIVII